MKKNIFERYAPFIKEYIYRKKWTDLHDVQVEACEAILDTDRHVIIASGTASGKTEAAFFPMLTLLEKNPSKSVGIMYIGPLKALINDQFERLNELLEEQEIPVWPWHGDVSQSIKKKAVKSAKGIIQITPESLESLMIRQPGEVQILFSDLRFVVIDEIHALMGEDRGLQVMCLLERLERLTGCSPRRIGLSATLNEYESAMKFLSAGTERTAIAVGMKQQERSLALYSESFMLPAEERKKEQIREQYYSFLYEQCHNQKCLIFANSRSATEEIISNMKRIAEQHNEPDVFFVHHGSVSAEFRKDAEQALKEWNGPTVAAATLTLELGIDIGDLDSTIQVEAPFTCSSFVQRLGRSGRRNGKSQMLFLNLLEETEAESPENLPWNLLQSIAIIQLYLEERWVEPFEQKEKPFSLLAHQTLSILMTYGELHPAELAEKVLPLSPFYGKITQEEYKDLLRYMLEKDYIQRMENGGLIVGLKGEKIANYYGFYAVFPEEETYHVFSQKSEIGMLTKCPALGTTFALAGRSWKVETIDFQKKKIFVKSIESSNHTSWSGNGGDVHTKIFQRIGKLLSEDIIYPYLGETSIELLQNARKTARKNGMLDHNIAPITETSFYYFPWCGTKGLRTIEKLFSGMLKEKLGIYSVVNGGYFLIIHCDTSAKIFKERLDEIKVELEDPEKILDGKENLFIDKYDYMVPEKLLKKAYLYNQMDRNILLHIMDKDI